MRKTKQLKIFLVDDDSLFLKSIQFDFEQENKYVVETFPTGELCIAAIDKQPDFIILDYHLDSIEKDAMHGIATLDAIKALDSKISVIMLSSQDKIEVAIESLHHGAIDYVVKSETSFMRLQKIIENISKFKKVEQELSWYMNRM